MTANLLAALARSPFYQRKLAGQMPATLAEVPFTTKAELVADQHDQPPYGSNLTRPVDDFTRMHQSSGTSTGRPLAWLDTPQSWQWLLGRWRIIYQLVGVKPGDRLFFAFSFGPFLGFWTAFEAAQQLGTMTITAGGMSSAARLRMLLDHAATVVLCTPTYALHLAEVAAQESLDLPASPVRALVVAGEPGGLISATRQRLEIAWGARVFDHYGLTEVGPVAVEPATEPGALLVVDGYVAEIIDPQTLQPAEEGELVLTNLGRLGSPLARYRTGDLVRGQPTARGLRLVGGILGRADDMIHVRGNNVYPTAIEAVIRRFPEVAEYRIEVDATAALAELSITIEPTKHADGPTLSEHVAKAIRDELLFRPTVVSVNPGTLPRFEMKARRLHVTK